MYIRFDRYKNKVIPISVSFVKSTNKKFEFLRLEVPVNWSDLYGGHCKWVSSKIGEGSVG
jgi:hypothetical protein